MQRVHLTSHTSIDMITNYTYHSDYMYRMYRDFVGERIDIHPAVCVRIDGGS